MEWQQEERPFRTRLDFGAVYKRMVFPLVFNVQISAIELSDEEQLFLHMEASPYSFTHCAIARL